MRATKKYTVIAANGHLHPQGNHQCIAGLGVGRGYRRKGSELMERIGDKPTHNPIPNSRTGGFNRMIQYELPANGDDNSTGRNDATKTLDTRAPAPGTGNGR
ncbi:hypothetical protein EVAR_54887_1 [Eumeta japonica]|uniref:Uncharacterized protein n=1 Tax=Eumeta variegata TaxID=151549 RepID=A0A4C1ZYQ6_EUMVA|nr:hypothetical protein EVAR_54887_1 [Eumeta japonica]